MIVVDSSFLVAFFDETDSQHQKAIQDMKKYDEDTEEFIITEHILGETATVLRYYNGLDAAISFLDFAKEKCIFRRWDNDDHQATLSVFKNQKHKIGYIDASLVYLSRFLRAPIVTYDDNILKELKEE